MKLLHKILLFSGDSFPDDDNYDDDVDDDDDDDGHDDNHKSEILWIKLMCEIEL